MSIVYLIECVVRYLVQYVKWIIWYEKYCKLINELYIISESNKTLHIGTKNYTHLLNYYMIIVVRHQVSIKKKL